MLDYYLYTLVYFALLRLVIPTSTVKQNIVNTFKLKYVFILGNVREGEYI